MVEMEPVHVETDEKEKAIIQHSCRDDVAKFERSQTEERRQQSMKYSDHRIVHRMRPCTRLWRRGTCCQAGHDQVLPAGSSAKCIQAVQYPLRRGAHLLGLHIVTHLIYTNTCEEPLSSTTAGCLATVSHQQHLGNNPSLLQHKNVQTTAAWVGGQQTEPQAPPMACLDT